MKKNIIYLLFLVLFAVSCDNVPDPIVYDYTEYSATKAWEEHPTLTGVSYKGEYSFFVDYENMVGKFEYRYIWNGTLTADVTWNNIEFKSTTVFEDKVYREVVLEFALSTLSLSSGICFITSNEEGYRKGTVYNEIPEGYDSYKTTYIRAESQTISSATDDVSDNEWKTVYNPGVNGLLLISNTDDTSNIMNVFHLVYYIYDEYNDDFLYFNSFDSTTEPKLDTPFDYNKYTKK